MVLTEIGTIKDLCGRYGFNFSKGLGQNFLVNPSVCPRMAEVAEGRNVIEIGPGFGVLTAELLKVAKRVISVEIDKKLLPVLAETVPNVKIINEDILKIDIQNLIENEFGGEDVVVCANLPYYITTPVIMHLLENNVNIKNITVMVQKELAQRLCAKIPSRQTGAITYAIDFYGNIKKLFDVSRGSFFPMPNVDSTVIQIDLCKKYETKDEKKFFEIIQKAFGQRRKVITNSIGISKEKLAELGIKPTARAEELLPQDFLKIVEILI
jgi:16S rRNA (adenine1518-N6/adenine1519-N6)-dimethyltransferase